VNEALKVALASGWRGLIHGGFLTLFILGPFKLAAEVGLGWMFVGSAMVILATGARLAYKMQMNPFTEMRNHQ